MAKLATNTLTSNGDTTVVDWGGGSGLISAKGTWGGGTLTAYVSFDNGTSYIPTGSNGILVADGLIGFNDLPACKIKTTLSGSTSPSLVVSIESLK